MTVIWSEKAAKEIVALARGDRSAATRIRFEIGQLGAGLVTGKPLTGNLRGVFSLRVGAYRVIYKPLGTNQIEIAEIGHRREVYR
jgi:mRNA interferase RelE/StbE